MDLEGQGPGKSSNHLPQEKRPLSSNKPMELNTRPLARSQWTLMNRDDGFGPRIQTSAAGMNQEPNYASD